MPVIAVTLTFERHIRCKTTLLRQLDEQLRRFPLPPHTKYFFCPEYGRKKKKLHFHGIIHYNFCHQNDIDQWLLDWEEFHGITHVFTPRGSQVARLRPLDEGDKGLVIDVADLNRLLYTIKDQALWKFVYITNVPEAKPKTLWKRKDFRAKE